MSYLQSPRAIILTVVSATSDFQEQAVDDLMRSPKISQRMMGVITKPGGALSPNVIDLVQNHKRRLGFGWHVVRNFSHEVEDRTSKHMDIEEQDFFTLGVWSRLPTKDLGIESLKQKLCNRLFESTKWDIPVLISEMDEQLMATRRSIDQLDDARIIAESRLLYLSEIRRDMDQLVSSASDGFHDHPSHSDFFARGDLTRLRNSISNRNEDFDQRIRSTGKTYIIQHDDSGLPSSSWRLCSSRLTLRRGMMKGFSTFPSVPVAMFFRRR